MAGINNLKGFFGGNKIEAAAEKVTGKAKEAASAVENKVSEFRTEITHSEDWGGRKFTRESSFDANDKLVKTVDSYKNVTIESTYGDNGRVNKLKKTYADDFNISIKTLEQDFHPNGKKSKEVFNYKDGTVSERTYNENEDPLSIIDKSTNGQISKQTFEYDANGFEVAKRGVNSDGTYYEHLTESLPGGGYIRKYSSNGKVFSSEEVTQQHRIERDGNGNKTYEITWNKDGQQLVEDRFGKPDASGYTRTENKYGGRNGFDIVEQIHTDANGKTSKAEIKYNNSGTQEKTKITYEPGFSANRENFPNGGIKEISSGYDKDFHRAVRKETTTDLDGKNASTKIYDMNNGNKLLKEEWATPQQNGLVSRETVSDSEVKEIYADGRIKTMRYENGMTRTYISHK